MYVGSGSVSTQLGNEAFLNLGCDFKGITVIEFETSPDWCGSVGWVFCKLIGHRFDSQSGHMLGLGVRSLARACESN